MQKGLEMRLEISGQTPSSKNSPTVFVRGGKIIHLPNKLYLKWKKTAVAQVLEQVNRYNKSLKWKYPVDVYLFFVRDSKRIWDYNNVSQAVMDVLVSAGVIEDDDVYHCRPVFEGFSIDKHCPKVIIEIKEVK